MISIQSIKAIFVSKRPDDFRRKWDVEEIEEKAKRALEDDDDDDSDDDRVPVKRELLKARDYKVYT